MLYCKDFGNEGGCCWSCHEDFGEYGWEYGLCELDAEATGRGEAAQVCCSVANDIERAMKEGQTIGCDGEWIAAIKGSR